jgi:uncharacterized protein
LQLEPDVAQRFDWNPEKAEANFRKHGVSFREAASVFADPQSVSFPDDLHSANEERWIIIGHSSQLRILLAVYVERSEVIRIISARKATRSERRQYEEGPI